MNSNEPSATRYADNCSAASEAKLFVEKDVACCTYSKQGQNWMFRVKVLYRDLRSC